jgi:hypothetical protein
VHACMYVCTCVCVCAGVWVCVHWWHAHVRARGPSGQVCLCGIHIQDPSWWSLCTVCCDSGVAFLVCGRGMYVRYHTTHLSVKSRGCVLTPALTSGALSVCVEAGDGGSVPVECSMSTSCEAV